MKQETKDGLSFASKAVYYDPDPEKVTAAMRPSETLNGIVDNV